MRASRSRATPNGANHQPADGSEPSPETLAAAFQHAMIGMAIGDADGRLRDANPTFMRMLGYTRDELLSLSIDDVTHADDQAADGEQWSRLERGEIDAYQREKRYVRKNGTPVWALVVVSALRDEAGRFLGTTAQAQDITAQKIAEDALRENASQLEEVVDHLPILLYRQPWGGRHVVSYVSPRFVQQTGLAPEHLPATFETLLERAHPDDQEHLRAVDERANRTGEPVHAHYRLRGADGEWIWLDHHAVLMRDEKGLPLAWHGSIVDVSERKRLESSLRESELLFRQAFTHAAIGMALANPDDVCLDANEVFCAIVGVPREALIGRPIPEMTHPDDRADAAARLERLVSGEIDTYVTEKRYLRPDGTVVSARLNMSAVRDESGAMRYCIGQVEDITAQKAAAAALRESEEHLRSVVERVPAAVYRLEPGAEGRFTFATPRFKALTGLSIETTPKRLEDFFGRVHPDDLQRLRDADAEAGRTGLAFDIEYRLRGEDGSWAWVHDRSVPARDEQGNIIAWHGVLLDISERKRLQETLQENEARLQSLIEHLPGAVYSIDPDPSDAYRYTSPQFEELTGLSAEDVARGSSALDSRTHPDDLETAPEFPDAACETYEAEYRLLGKDGEWRWVHDRAVLARDAQGEPLAWHGVLLDVTERKRLQDALAENEARLRLLVEQLPVAVFSLEPPPSTRYAYVSPRFGELTGMSAGEIARGVDALFARMHPDDIPVVRDADRRTMETGQHQVIAYRLRHDDGRWVWLQERSVLARDEAGRALAWHGVLLDVSAQRRLEETLRESEARFRTTFEGASIGMALATPECRVIMANPALERLLGFAPGALIGVNADDLTFPDDLAAHTRLRERLATGETNAYQLEMRYVRRDGQIIWVHQDVSVVRDTRGEIQLLIAQILDISDRKEAEAALRQSETRFQSIFENAAIGMSLTGTDSRIQIANPALGALLGYTSDELIGRSIHEITDPEDWPRQEQFRQRLRTGESDAYQMEKRYRRKDGGLVWGLLSVSTVHDDEGQLTALIGQVQDITARKEAEAALRASEARFRAVVQHDPDVFVIVNPEMEITYISPAARTALGVAPEEALGPIDLGLHRVHTDDLERVLGLFTRVSAGPGSIATVEARIIHARLGWRWFQITIANRTATPGIDGYLFNLRDITERKHAETATIAALKSQQAAIDELERLNRSKTDFLATISHEFRTPLTSIIGYSELMTLHASDPELVAEDAAIIHREASRLNRMVDDVLLIDHGASGNAPLHKTSAPLNAVVRNAVETFRPIAGAHEFVLDLDPDLQRVDGDIDRLSQALTNLISNAVKYSPRGGTITITTRNDGAWVRVSVRDEGIGIAKKDTGRIFERFERVGTGSAGRVEGAGLGLAIVQEIVTMHGGTVWVDSKLHKGSLFSISLPASGDAATEQARGDGPGYTPRTVAT